MAQTPSINFAQESGICKALIVLTIVVAAIGAGVSVWKMTQCSILFTGRKRKKGCFPSIMMSIVVTVVLIGVIAAFVLECQKTKKTDESNRK